MLSHASIPTHAKRLGRVAWLRATFAADLHRAFLVNEDVAMQRTWIEGGAIAFFNRLIPVDPSDECRCLQWVVRRFLDRGLSIADIPETRHLLARLVTALRSSEKASRVLRRVSDVDHLRLVVRYAERGATNRSAQSEETGSGTSSDGRAAAWREAA